MKPAAVKVLMIAIGAAFFIVSVLAFLPHISFLPTLSGSTQAIANGGPVVTLYATRQAIVRNAPTTVGTQIIARIARGDVIQGSWATGSGGSFHWLQISAGPYAGNFVSGANLSIAPRPSLVRSLDQDMTVRRRADLVETPSTTEAPIQRLDPGLVVHVGGEVQGGWMEIQRKVGGVGYVPIQAFSDPATIPAVEEGAGVGGNLPGAVIDSLNRSYPGWHVPAVSAETRQYCLRQESTFPPFVVWGDFDGNGSRDYGVAIDHNGKRVVVAFLFENGTYQGQVLTNDAFPDMLSLAKAGGQYFDHETNMPGSYRSDAITLIYCEKSSVAYIFESGRFRRVFVSD